MIQANYKKVNKKKKKSEEKLHLNKILKKA